MSIETAPEMAHASQKRQKTTPTIAAGIGLLALGVLAAKIFAAGALGLIVLGIVLTARGFNARRRL